MNTLNNTPYDTEFEGDEISPSFEGPFGPNQIDVDIAVVNLGSLLEMMTYGEIELLPKFMRPRNVWSNEKKSKLIESVIIGLPLPSFFLSEDSATNKLVVIDGLQRLCAFKEFWIDEQKLKLRGLEFLPNLNGKTVNELNRTYIRRIKSAKITLNILHKNTSPMIKYVLFQRINTAGVPLNQQEMRNTLYQGKATMLLNRMVNAESFKNATGNRINPKRMADYDFANRFLAFYLKREQYKGELDPFMADALEQVNKMQGNEIDEIYDAFDRAMAICYQLLGDKAFRRPDPKKQNVFLKVNKAIFDVLSVSIANLTVSEQETLRQKKDLFSERIHSLFLNGEFIQSVTVGTAKEPQVNYRYSKVNELIKSIVNYDN